MRSSLLLGLALLICGCASEPQRQAAPNVEPLVTRLRDYVYATYDVDANRDEASLEKLRAARKALASQMEAASLHGETEGLPALVTALRERFQQADLVFVPIGKDAAGVLLVRVARRLDVKDRDIAGLKSSYSLVVFDDAAIEDVESYRRRGTPAPPARPVARAVGNTIYVDRGVARWLARQVVIPRAASAEALARRAAAGEALAPVERKDLLRHRSLEAEIRAGEGEVARVIAREEELRLAALLAAAPADPRRLEDPATAARVERTATLGATAAGEPRYHLASAIAATIGAPGTPPAAGAAEALAAFAGKPLEAWSADDLRARARQALAAKN